MSAISHAVGKIGDGIKSVAEGAGHAIEGAAETVGGALTANPDLMKKGANQFAGGIGQEVSGVCGIASGALGGAVNSTPLGAAVNAMTNGAAGRLAEGVGDSAAAIVNTGLTGVEHLAGGAVTGNVSEFLSGLKDTAMTASYAIPGAGEEELAARMALSAAESLGENSVKDSAENTAMNALMG